MNRVELDLKALHALFAAEVRCLDLREPPVTDPVTAFRQATDDRAVLVIRDQTLNDEQQIVSAGFASPRVQPGELHIEHGPEISATSRY